MYQAAIFWQDVANSKNELGVLKEPPKTICIVKIAYFIIAWIPWAGDLPTAKATETTHEKSLASGISLHVLIGRKNIFFT